jgi:eukaryotic-like serine/threonine-protein kinase
MPESPTLPGQVLAGKYRVERLLGEGGHGVVVAAEHLTLGERVAIKLLRPEIATDAETVARFLREARASVRIKGEHVTRVLDVGALADGLPYMVMECLEGSDLSSVIATEGALPWSLVIDYALQTCEALAEAHGIGIVHRDIKPSNLFLTKRPDGSACIKVLDFGISKSVGPIDSNAVEANLTQTQTVLGSPQYMAPEQMRSSRKVDGRTDIWALGTTMYELLTGRPPFEADALPELFAMILQDTPRPIRETRPDVPPKIDTIVSRCIEKDPEKRFTDIAELARALGPLASNAGAASAERIVRVGLNAAQSSSRLGVFASTPVQPAGSRSPSTTVRSRKVFVLAGGIAFAAALASATVLVVARRRPPPVAPMESVDTHSLSQPPALSEPRVLAASATPKESPTTTNAAPTETATTEPAPTSATPSQSGRSLVAKQPGKKVDPRPGPSAATSARAGSPSVARPEVPRSPGVASSRYD